MRKIDLIMCEVCGGLTTIAFVVFLLSYITSDVDTLFYSILVLSTVGAATGLILMLYPVFDKLYIKRKTGSLQLTGESK